MAGNTICKFSRALCCSLFSLPPSPMSWQIVNNIRSCRANIKNNAPLNNSDKKRVLLVCTLCLGRLQREMLDLRKNAPLLGRDKEHDVYFQPRRR